MSVGIIRRTDAGVALDGPRKADNADQSSSKREILTIAARIIGVVIPILLINPLNPQVTCPECFIGSISYNLSLSKLLVTMVISGMCWRILPNIFARI